MPLKTYHHVLANYEDVLKSNAAMQTLSEDELMQLFNQSNSVHYAKRDIVFKQNTRVSQVLFILSGLVKVFKEGKNSRVVSLKIAGPGQIIGLPSAFGSDWHEYSASPIEDTELLFSDVETIRELARGNGAFASALLETMAADSLFLIEKLLSYSHKQLPGRIADVLLYFSQEVFGSDEFTVPLTRQELAELAGTTKESFIRTLNEFKHDKIIELDARRIKIISPKLVRILSELG